jgi:glyoxylate carboligase
LVKALENEGVEVIYGVPGEENLDLLEALRTSSIRLILTRHEQEGQMSLGAPWKPIIVTWIIFCPGQAG